MISSLAERAPISYIASADMLHEDLVVNDIVYTPMETSLIKEALKANAEVVYGYKMLLYQGIRSFEIWLGRDAPVDVMEKALLDVLEETTLTISTIDA